MNNQLTQKREHIDLMHERLRANVGMTKSELSSAATSPTVLLSAFALGFVLYNARRRRSSTSAASGTVSPRLRQLFMLAGGFLGSAIRRSLFGLIQDISQSEATGGRQSTQQAGGA